RVRGAVSGAAGQSRPCRRTLGARRGAGGIQPKHRRPHRGGREVPRVTTRSSGPADLGREVADRGRGGAMRSFRLYVGHRGRLTTAGRGVAVLSVATAAALGLAGGSSTVLRFGPAGPVIYAWCVAVSGLLVWSVATRLCPLWGVPLVDREGHESTGTVGST